MATGFPVYGLYFLVSLHVSYFFVVENGIEITVRKSDFPSSPRFVSVCSVTCLNHFSEVHSLFCADAEDCMIAEWPDSNGIVSQSWLIGSVCMLGHVFSPQPGSLLCLSLHFLLAWSFMVSARESLRPSYAPGHAHSCVGACTSLCMHVAS